MSGDNQLTVFHVRYRVKGALTAEIFRCEAEDKEHAREQALNAYPDAKIWRVYRPVSLSDAVQERVIRAAYADLVGVYQCAEERSFADHDFHAHFDTIKDLESTFPYVMDGEPFEAQPGWWMRLGIVCDTGNVLTCIIGGRTLHIIIASEDEAMKYHAAHADKGTLGKYTPLGGQAVTWFKQA